LDAWHAKSDPREAATCCPRTVEPTTHPPRPHDGEGNRRTHLLRRPGRVRAALARCHHPTSKSPRFDPPATLSKARHRRVGYDESTASRCKGCPTTTFCRRGGGGGGGDADCATQCGEGLHRFVDRSMAGLPVTRNSNPPTPADVSGLTSPDGRPPSSPRHRAVALGG